MAVGAESLISQTPPVTGFATATAACGIKSSGTTDLLVVKMDPGTVVAGVFTRNQFAAAPVIVCQERMGAGRSGALVVNSGCANAATGPAGLAAAYQVTQLVGDLLHRPAAEVFVSSTGVIGKPLPTQLIIDALPGIGRELETGACDFAQAARAIMTTDTFPKMATRQFQIFGKTGTIVGIAKGAGMIHPDMATMLAYLFTDVVINPGALRVILQNSVNRSFNSISVDGDSSTNDTVLAFASGRLGNQCIENQDEPLALSFVEAVVNVCQDLARAIVRDGEGATKFITIVAKGAANSWQAKQVGMSVAGSSLVKTAFYGNDPNWGRILAAIGYAGIGLETSQVELFLDELQVVAGGVAAPGYTEELGKQVMARSEITVTIKLGEGEGEHTVWTCDLSHEYVTINAEYRT